MAQEVRNSRVLAVLQAYPQPAKELKYGTAGFRDRADLPLHSMFARMGVLAVLRSRSAKGAAIGVMITASHNDECDNGVKLVDSDGGMLSHEWEPHTETLANARTEDFLSKLAAIEAADPEASSSGGLVVVGRDTRPHSDDFLECVRRGAEAVGGTVIDLGRVTTPQLHFVVQRANEGGQPADLDVDAALGEYYSTLSSGFAALLSSSSTGGPGAPSVVIDCSAGVGSGALQHMLAHMSASYPSPLLVADLRNLHGSGPVNEGCGAELVQKQQTPPKGVDQHSDANKLLCSLDGDADRIVFHAFLTRPRGDGWVLIDGDKIAALLSVVLVEELKHAGLSDEFSLGVVQTAYANGASTKFLRERGVEVAMAKTGVKFLHHEALRFDLGVYFEANGHGTVLMSTRYRDHLASLSAAQAQAQAGAGAGAEGGGSRAALAVQRLRALEAVINQAVGDAISDLLASLACLRLLGMEGEPQQWAALFTDLPSRQLKVAVENKSILLCSEDETYLLEPAELAAELKQEMQKATQGRCFVRPSGTEDVVRVYAEAATQAEADALAEAARVLVVKYCNRQP